MQIFISSIERLISPIYSAPHCVLHGFIFQFLFIHTLVRGSIVPVVVFSGTVLAVTVGLVYGLRFTPVIYIQQHPQQYPAASSNGRW